MAKKFYVIKNGRKLGIFEVGNRTPLSGQAEDLEATIPIESYQKDIQPLVSGYPRPRFLGFEKLPEAVAYWNAGRETVETDCYAYTDGSFCKETGCVGSGCVLVTPQETVELTYSTTDALAASQWQIAGELNAIRVAVEKAKDLGAEGLVIYYDYEGVGNFANGDFRAKDNQPIEKAYVDFVRRTREAGFGLQFVAVDAHTGVELNEKADRLAKRAAGFTGKD